jgi:hypothetical protein
MTMRRFAIPISALVMAIGLGLPAMSARAAPPVADPDWPCRQRLVPALTAATFWSGPPLPADVDWQADPRIAKEVEAVASRDVPVDDATADLTRFVDTVAPGERAALLPAVFIGLVAETNRQRGDVITHIKDLARRQRGIGDVIARITAELNGAPPDPSSEIGQRRALVIRSFEETERTMRYACEVPVELEARIGSFARILAAPLQPGAN